MGMYDNYQDNIYPQFIRFVEQPSLGDVNVISKTIATQKFIVINDSKLKIIEAWEEKSETELNKFFIPIDKYLEYEFTLKTNIDDVSQYTILNYGNIGDDIEGVRFVMIYPLYHKTEIKDQNLWNLQYRYSDDPTWENTGYAGYYPDNSPGDINTWRTLGRILMIDSSIDKPIKPIYLQNRLESDVILRILIAQ